MANINITVVDNNNVNATILPPATQVVNIVPTPNQTISIDRGIMGPPGPNTIGGWPISVASAQAYDVLMFDGAAWTNTPQVEITDGGNY